MVVGAEMHGEGGHGDVALVADGATFHGRRVGEGAVRLAVSGKVGEGGESFAAVAAGVTGGGGGGGW